MLIALFLLILIALIILAMFIVTQKGNSRANAVAKIYDESEAQQQDTKNL